MSRIVQFPFALIRRLRNREWLRDDPVNADAIGLGFGLATA
ncbi:MAG: hypothetical protein ABSE85_06075 [Candidatus Korobacteraceae bacterium]